MNRSLKRGLSFLLSLVMVFSMIQFSGMVAYAIPADPTLQFTENPYTVTESASDQSVTITLAATSAFSCNATGGTVSSLGGLTLTDVLDENGNSIYGTDFNAGTKMWNHLPDESNADNVDIQNIISLVLTVPGGAVAGTEYTVSISDLVLGWWDADEVDQLGYTVSENWSATIRVVEESTAPAWELYYTVDKATDNDSDKYPDTYIPGDDVVVTIYIKAAAIGTLQAFDIWVENDSNLNFKNYASDNASRIANSDATHQHLQAVGENEDDPINIALPAGTGVEIATITFTVADTAVYNEGMPITITAASNIAVAGTPASFTPDRQTVSSTTLGVETLKTYTISYDGNAGTDTFTNVPSEQTKQHNVALTLSNDEPSRTGYNFTGWNTVADGSGDSYAKGASYTANVNATLYAQWEKKTYTVTWKSQDGLTTLGTSTVAYNDIPTYPVTDPAFEEPEKEDTDEFDYTFAGWADITNMESGTARENLPPVTQSIAYYAAFSKVTKEYTVTWKSQDGGTTYETDQNVPYGTAPSYDQASNPTKEADATYKYTFANWATSANQESGTPVESLPTVTGNTEYFAAFSKEYINYTVSYALGDHPASTATAPAAETNKHNGDEITLPDGPAAADGYVFVNWSDGTTTYNAGDTYTINGSGATMTAQYTPKTYTIAYDGNTSTGGTAPASHTNQSFTAEFTAKANTFEKNGYTFNGWNTKANGTGTPVTAGNPYTIATLNLDSATLAGTTVTLYAQWVRETDYTISYELNGGSLAEGVTNPTAYNVDTPTFTLNNPTRTGYTFKGWSGTDLEGDENTTVTIAQGSTGARSYTANWTPAEVNYTVNHYQEDLEGNYPATPTDTETKQGYTESNTAAVAKSYEHFTAQEFSQVQIAADGTTVVNIYYLRDTYTVTYTYTGNVPGGQTAPDDASSPYKYGATVTIKDVPAAVNGYTFGGWKIGDNNAESFEIDADTTITGNWTLNTYHIYFEDDQGNLVTDGDQTFTAENGTITEPAVPAKTENADWYDAGAWGSYSTSTLENQHVRPVYNELTFTVSYQDENGNPYTSTDMEYTISDPTVTKPTTVPTKDGYTVTWPDPDTSTAGDKTVTATYTATEYTITFVLDGGTDIAADAANGITATNTMKYTIESTWPLPTASGKTNFNFANWKVTATDNEDGWASNSLINGGTAVTGKWGNVTLTAQWEQSLNYAVQEYKYAAAGYKMLIIDAAGAGEGKVYTYDGATMYYTTDENYQIGTSDNHSTAVFYTLIEADALTLTDAQVGKIATGTGDKATITYNGDVNGDGKVNIADANAIFQMVVATGSYYGESQLTIAQRLAADMVKATDNAEYRGSIEDVNAVVEIING